MQGRPQFKYKYRVGKREMEQRKAGDNLALDGFIDIGFFIKGKGGNVFKSDFYTREFMLNGVKHLGMDVKDVDFQNPDAWHSDKEIRKAVASLIDQDEDSQLVSAFMQAVNQNAGIQIANIIMFSTKNVSDPFQLKIKESLIDNFETFYDGDGKLFVRLKYDSFPIRGSGEQGAAQLGELPGPLEAVFELKKQGEQYGLNFCYVDTDNPDIIRMLCGEIFDEEYIRHQYCGREVQLKTLSVNRGVMDEVDEMGLGFSDDDVSQHLLPRVVVNQPRNKNQAKCRDLLAPEDLNQDFRNIENALRDGNYDLAVTCLLVLEGDINKLKPIIGKGGEIATRKNIKDFSVSDAIKFIADNYPDMSGMLESLTRLNGAILENAIQDLNQTAAAHEDQVSVTEFTRLSTALKVFAGVRNTLLEADYFDIDFDRDVEPVKNGIRDCDFDTKLFNYARGKFGEELDQNEDEGLYQLAKPVLEEVDRLNADPASKVSKRDLSMALLDTHRLISDPTLHRVNAYKNSAGNIQKRPWGKILGAAMLGLAGAALIGLSIAGVIFTCGAATPIAALGFLAGVSIASVGFTIATAAVGVPATIAGAKLFASNVKKQPLRKEMEKLADTAKKDGPGQRGR